MPHTLRTEPDFAPEVERGAARRATDDLASLLGRTGERPDTVSAEPGTERPTPLSQFARAETFADRPPTPQVLSHYMQARARREAVAEARRDQMARPRPAPGSLTVLDLRAGDCRFVAGDTPFLFCGAPAVTGCSWCADHARTVYAGSQGGP